MQQEQQRTLGPEAAELNNQGQSLLQQGQKSQIDLTLSAQLVETDTNQRALIARDQVLAKKEQEYRNELKRYPALLAEYTRLKPQVEQSNQRLQEVKEERANIAPGTC